MINRLVHPIVSDFFKAWWVTWIFHWNSSGCCFKNVSHYMSKTGLFFQSCRHVLNWEGRTRVEWREDFRTRPSPYSRSASSACFALLLSTARSFSLLLRLTKASLNYWVSVERSVVSPLSSVHTVLRSSDFYIQSWSEAESELNRPVNEQNFRANTNFQSSLKKLGEAKVYLMEFKIYRKFMIYGINAKTFVDI